MNPFIVAGIRPHGGLQIISVHVRERLALAAAAKLMAESKIAKDKKAGEIRARQVARELGRPFKKGRAAWEPTKSGAALLNVNHAAPIKVRRCWTPCSFGPSNPWSALMVLELLITDGVIEQLGAIAE